MGRIRNGEKVLSRLYNYTRYVLVFIMIFSSMACQGFMRNVLTMLDINAVSREVAPTPTSTLSLETNKGVVVQGEAVGAPQGCSAQDVAYRVMSFTDAVNHGNPNVVIDFFGHDEELFQWYSMTLVKSGKVENHFVAYTLDELKGYFTERYKQHELLHLSQIQVNSWEAERGLVHFGPITLLRSADDLQPSPSRTVYTAEGKGAFHCKEQKFAVLSLATYLPKTF